MRVLFAVRCQCLAATATAVIAVVAVVATAAPQNHEQDDNPAAVSAAEHAVIAHCVSSFRGYSTYYYMGTDLVTDFCGKSSIYKG